MTTTDTTTDKLDMLKDFASATTLSGMKKILVKAGQGLSPDFQKMEKTEGNANIFRFVVLMVTLVAITTIASFAYAGGDISMSHGGSAAILCAAVDVTLALCFYFQVFEGKLKYFLLIFEVVTLVLLGYLMTGYFGKDNLKTVTDSKLTADYEIVNKYRVSVQSIADQTASAARNAAEVARIEFERDGKGVVYEKAMMIANVKPDSIPTVSQMAKTPDFTSLLEANKYLHAERKKLSNLITKMKAAGIATQQQAKGVNSALKQAFEMGLSQQQISNLQVLSSTLTSIEQADISNAALADDILNHDDLKSDGIQGMFGYGADVFVILCIVLLASKKKDDSNIEKIRESEAKSVIADILSEERIPFSSDKVGQMKFKLLYESIKTMMGDEKLKAYVKKHMSFNDFLEFMQDYPVLAQKLGTTDWAFRDIKKELKEDPGFESLAQDAITISPSGWRAISTTADPVLILEMEEKSRNSFVEMLINLSNKLTKPEKVKEFMGKFIKSYKNVSPDFLSTLEICIEKLAAKQLGFLTPEFVKGITPAIAAHLCPMIDSKSENFNHIVNGWNEEITENYEDILGSGLTGVAQFNRLWKSAIEYGGFDAMLAMMDAYEQRKKECSGTTIGGRIVTIEPKFEEIQTAINAGRTEEFLKLIDSAFVAKAKMMRV